jgi:hypothetical protein
MFEYEKIDFEKSMARQSAKWIGSDFISRNLCFLFPSFFIVIMAISFAIHINSIRQYSVPNAVFIIFPIMLVLSILSLRAIIKNDKLIKTYFECSVSELRITLRKELEQNGWKVNRSNVKYLTACKKGFWLAGTKIAILFNNNEAYVNVQNMYGNGAYFPFSFGRNKRYSNMIIHIVNSNGR